MDTYLLFGRALESAWRFEHPLLRVRPARHPPDLRFDWSERPPALLDAETEPVFGGGAGSTSGEASFQVHRRDSEVVVRYSGMAEFRIRHERVRCHLLDPALRHVVEIGFLGLVLALWFELRHVPVLHGSCVSVRGRTAVFIGGNRAGKTSLAASLMLRGHELIADDVVPIDFIDGEARVYPGPPAMRMWPDLAEWLGIVWEPLARAHPGFSKRRVPVGGSGFGLSASDATAVAAVYVPSRRAANGGPARVDVLPLSAGEAVIELVRHSYAPKLMTALDLDGTRLEALGRLVRTVPVKRVLYPSGTRHLPLVAEAILADLEADVLAGGGPS